MGDLSWMGGYENGLSRNKSWRWGQDLTGSEYG